MAASPALERMHVARADITTIQVDAIVNAANTSLLGGGGVDGAIHRAAGPQLLDECRGLRGCQTGEAKITGGYRLPAKHVLHTPGPVWHGGGAGEPDLLQRCYRNCLRLAIAHELRTVAFPAISTGVYGFPRERASGIAVRTVLEILGSPAGSQLDVTFCCFSEADAELYRQTLGDVAG